MVESVQIPFSARNRGPHRQIDKEFPASARVGLLHLLFELVKQEYVAGWDEIARELHRIGRLPPVEYEQSSVPALRRAKEDAESALNSLSWEKAFDFCERLHGRLACEVAFYDDDYNRRIKTAKSEVQAYIAHELQRLFLEEALAFEFSDGVVRRRGRKHTVEQVGRANLVLGDVRLAAARKHYDKALQFFRNPANPDYENAVKEAVCAVEPAGKSLFPMAKATTLGNLAKWLANSKEVEVPKALAQTITDVYAYRSGGDGVGHGGASGGIATAEVAEYILALCASQIIYLVDLSSSQDRALPF